MSNAIVKQDTQQVNPMKQFVADSSEIWKDREAIKAICCPKNISKEEFEIFVSLGMALGANPFIKGEIWAVKYGNGAASIFVGRDLYRKYIQNQPDYESHYVEAVREKDIFHVKTTNEGPQISHEWGIERGKLLGAYGMGRKKGVSQIFFIFCPLDEYNKGQSTWVTMPETLIKKVAESQLCRLMYSALGGTYSDTEQDVIEHSQKQTKTDKFKTELPTIKTEPIQENQPVQDMYQEPEPEKQQVESLDADVVEAELDELLGEDSKEMDLIAARDELIALGTKYLNGPGSIDQWIDVISSRAKPPIKLKTIEDIKNPDQMKWFIKKFREQFCQDEYEY